MLPDGPLIWWMIQYSILQISLVFRDQCGELTIQYVKKYNADEEWPDGNDNLKLKEQNNTKHDNLNE